MKKSLKLLLVLLTLTLFSLPAYGAEAKPEKVSVWVGDLIDMNAFAVEGDYYFNIRDVAMVLRGTPKSFTVFWDANQNAIILTSEKQSGNTEAISNSLGKDISSAKPSSVKLLLNGRQIAVKGMEINGSNFYDLEGLANALGIKYEFEASSKTFYLNTSVSTAESAPPAWPKLLSAKDIYEKCSPAVFFIETFDMYGGALARGSGFFIDKNGMAVTNLHVLDGAFSAKATLTDGRELTVSNVISANIGSDIAVIQVNGTNFPYLKMGDSQKTKGGEKIYTIGSPMGLSNTISEGIVSNPNRKVGENEYIQLSAPISHGSSGGALINERAEVIGITSLGIESGQNLNFAIPVSVLQTVMKQKQTKPISFEDLAKGMTIAEYDSLPEAFAYIVDEEEPNNTPEMAQYIDNGASVIGNVDLKTPDYFYSACNMPGTVYIYCFALGDGLKNVELSLSDGSGQTAVGTIHELDDGDIGIACELEITKPDYVDIKLVRNQNGGDAKKDIEYIFYYEFVPITANTN